MIAHTFFTKKNISPLTGCLYSWPLQYMYTTVQVAELNMDVGESAANADVCDVFALAKFLLFSLMLSTQQNTVFSTYCVE